MFFLFREFGVDQKGGDDPQEPPGSTPDVVTNRCTVLRIDNSRQSKNFVYISNEISLLKKK